MNKEFVACLCSVPVESEGTVLDRKRSDGAFGIVPKMAIISLIKWMERHGYKRENWDFYDIDMLYPSDFELRAYFKELQPDVVGLSAVVSTSYSQVKRISRIVREECPDCWIVMGGNLAASSETILLNTEVDITFIGDGEMAWVQFLDYAKKYEKIRRIDKLKEISGICLIDEDGKIYFKDYGLPVNANDIPFPDYSILSVGVRSNPDAINNYFRNGLSSGWFNLDDRAYAQDRLPNIAGVFASKGCVVKCTFCQRSTKGYRVLPLDAFAEHLKYLKEQHNVGFIQVLDENFGSNKKHSYKFAEILWEYNMLWVATGVRCTSISEEDIVYYKEHGCSGLKFGVESGSQKILDIMEKRFTINDVHKTLNICIKHGVYSPLAVMVGMPGEDIETARQTGEMIGQIAASIGIHPKLMGYDIFYALPLPGTPLYKYGEIVGAINNSAIGAGQYLDKVSNAGTYKRYYINLSGAPISEVIFWDILVALEASRSYRKHQKSVKIINHSVRQRYIEMFKSRTAINPRSSLKYTALDFTAITYFIDNYFIGNNIIDILPRQIVYPLIKWLNYMEYLLQKRFKRNLDNNIFNEALKNAPRIQSPKNIQTNMLDRSLREEIKKLKKSSG